MPDDENGLVSNRDNGVVEPALHVICLGSGGGPSEDNVTGLLIRSIASNWSKNSVLAVDAGSHLAGITRVLAKDFPLVSDPQPGESQQAQSGKENFGGRLPQDGLASSHRKSSHDGHTVVLNSGPFAGLTFNGRSARANAFQVVRDQVSTYLITHPHLDHLSGFAINTAAMHNTSRPKRLAALPSTVSAIKEHIFNDIIWPNLTDEDGGVGFVTFQRLAEGGNIALGEGFGRGYIEVCDGLGVKGFKVSHGNCMKGPGHVHTGSGAGLHHRDTSFATLQKSPYNGGMADGRRYSIGGVSQQSQPSTPAVDAGPCVIDSTAYFVRDDETGKEVLMFGDVEPDSLSLSPRTATVWKEAAPKIAAGALGGIFIECSYDDSQSDERLFGHLAPRHLVQELKTLAAMVAKEKAAGVEDDAEKHGNADEFGGSVKRVKFGNLKRKRTAGGTGLLLEEDEGSRPSRKRRSSTPEVAVEGKKNGVIPDTHNVALENGEEVAVADSTSLSPSSKGRPSSEGALRGVRVFIIHIKDTLRDGTLVGETILKQLKQHESDLRSQGEGLDCEFVICESGGSYFF